MEQIKHVMSDEEKVKTLGHATDIVSAMAAVVLPRPPLRLTTGTIMGVSCPHNLRTSQRHKTISTSFKH